MPNRDIQIADDGTVTVDGKVITPEEVINALPYADKVWREVTNKSSWNIKNVERAAVYVATVVTTSNVFGQIPMPNGVKTGVLFAAAIILGAIHVSTPKAS
jgi:hypothetical protein